MKVQLDKRLGGALQMSNLGIDEPHSAVRSTRRGGSPVREYCHGF